MIVRRPRTVPTVKGGPATARPVWVHEIKHDGYRLMVLRDGARVPCHDLADRFSAIVDAALQLKATSFLMDGEAVIARDDGTLIHHVIASRADGAVAPKLPSPLVDPRSDAIRIGDFETTSILNFHAVAATRRLATMTPLIGERGGRRH